MSQLYDNRVWIDGCFDFTHHGHSGAILQAKRTIPRDQREGSRLICGVHNDADIEYNKGGKPVMREQERYDHTASNRWCDEVVPDAPYVTDPKVLNSFGCRYVVHGDDITTDANGEDCYQEMKNTGRFKVVKRTEGVSTTEIIDRILSGTPAATSDKRPTLTQLRLYSTDTAGYDPWCWVFGHGMDDVVVQGSPLHPVGTSQWIVVSENDGFDLFNVGHVMELKELKSHDRLVCCYMQPSPSSSTYMTLEERCLSVLSCRYVDAILLGPCDFHKSNNIVHHTSTGTLKPQIVARIHGDREHYVKRNEKKKGI